MKLKKLIPTLLLAFYIFMPVMAGQVEATNEIPQPGDYEFIGPVLPQPGDYDFIGPLQKDF